MKFRIEAPGQPVAYGDYLDEMEARSVVRRSGLVRNMRAVKITPMWFWLRPERGTPVSGNYTESEARERFQSGKAMWPDQQLLMGPSHDDLTLVEGPEYGIPEKQRVLTPLEEWEEAVLLAHSDANKWTPLVVIAKLIVAGDKLAARY